MCFIFSVRLQRRTIIKTPFHLLPHTVADIKAQIQTVYQIPISSQTILLNSTLPLDSNLELSALGLKNKDTLTVRYFSKADCYSLDQCIDLLTSLLQTLKKHGLPEPHDDDILSRLHCTLNPDLEELVFNLFSPRLEPRVHANKVYFISNSGLDLLLELYSIPAECAWNDLCSEGKRFHSSLLISFGTFSENFEIR